MKKSYQQKIKELLKSKGVHGVTFSRQHQVDINFKNTFHNLVGKVAKVFIEDWDNEDEDEKVTKDDVLLVFLKNGDSADYYFHDDSTDIYSEEMLCSNGIYKNLPQRVYKQIYESLKLAL